MNKIEEAKYRLQTMKEFLREGYVDIKAARGCIDRAIALLEQASEKDAPSPSSTFTARLMLRKGTGDSQGKCVGYEYTTVLVPIPDCEELPQGPVANLPEVIGAEWLLTSEVEK